MPVSRDPWCPECGERRQIRRVEWSTVLWQKFKCLICGATWYVQIVNRQNG